MAETTENEAYRETEDGRVLVPLKLAHPMAKVYAERARIEPAKDYKVNDVVWVSREYGNALIEAGMVQVDPIDKQARQEVLLLNRRNQPLTAKELAEKVDGGEVEAPVAGTADQEQQPALDGAPEADAAAPARTEAGAPATAASAVKAAPATKGRTGA